MGRAVDAAVMRARPENIIQSDIVGFLRAALGPSYLVYANANASRRTASGRAANGVPGLLPGIPDLSVACPGGKILYFEVKTPKGVLSENQQWVIRRLTDANCCVAVVKNIAEVEGFLQLWGIPTRLAKVA